MTSYSFVIFIVDLLDKRTVRFDGWHAKKAHDLQIVKQKALRKANIVQDVHTKVIKHVHGEH